MSELVTVTVTTQCPQCLSAEAVSELVAVAECEAGPEDGPEHREHVGRDVDVGLEYRDPGVIHGVKQGGETVPH